MLFVVSVPNEYGAQLKKEARDNGKKITDLIRDILTNNFAYLKHENNNNEILKIVELANKSPNTHSDYTWNRQEIYDRFIDTFCCD